MTISNKDLFNLYNSVKSAYNDGVNGLYLEGFPGGVNAYATDGKAAFKKTFYGDNEKAFTDYWSTWKRKDGMTDIKEFDHGKDCDNKNHLPEIKACFETEKFNAFSVKGKEFKQAIKAVDAINRGGKKREIILSVHDGKFDIASWSDGDTAYWQLDGDYAGNGAVMVNRKYLDGVKSDTLEFSYSVFDNKTVLHIRGDIDAVILPQKLDNDDQKMFLEVLEYEYAAPVPPELKPATAKKPNLEKQARKPARKPREKKIKVFVGWKYNRRKVYNWITEAEYEACLR